MPALFRQVLDPAHNLGLSSLLALVPVLVLLIMLAGLRVTAWLATVIGSAVTVLLAVTAWHAPVGSTLRAYLYGSLTGVLAVDWITFWGVVIFNTLVVTGLFTVLRQWLVSQATADVRVQTMLLAWAFGALLEGLVGFGYPWAVVAPILVGLGIAELDAIRVAAIANNAPVSYGALGAPIIGLAAVTGLPVFTLAASVGRVVAVLALLPPWILIYLVSGRRGLRDGWPLAIVGSLGYIAGQLPVSQFFGPYLPDVVGSLTCFGSLLLLLRFWRPREVLGYRGVPITDRRTPRGEGEPLQTRQILGATLPFLVLIAVVVAWTGPWSSRFAGYVLHKYTVTAGSSIPHAKAAVAATFSLTPFIAGTAILTAWVVIVLALRPTGRELAQAFRRTFSQMWGALLVGVFIFGLAFVFNYAGLGNSLAYGFSRIGKPFLLLAPILGWIGVALSGSNTSTNALFGGFQLTIGRLLHFPVTLLPTLNSVGAEVGKPVAPQTASVGVSTSRYVRNEGAVIRHNLPWTLVLLAYLVVIGLVFYEVAPQAFR
jgi:L-lactate transport